MSNVTKGITYTRYEDLDPFYVIEEKPTVYLFHGTRLLSLTCDPALREDLWRKADAVCQKARDYFNEPRSDEEWEAINKWRKETGRVYFGSETIMLYGERHNFEYGDFYVTSAIETAEDYARGNPGGELLRLAYDNVLGLEAFGVDLGLGEDAAFIKEQYEAFKQSEPVILLLKKQDTEGLSEEGGGAALPFEYLYEDLSDQNYPGVIVNENFRVANPEESEFALIGEALFPEAKALFNLYLHHLFFSPLSEEDIKAARGFIHDVRYWAGAIEYKRSIPLEDYHYMFGGHGAKSLGKLVTARLSRDMEKGHLSEERFKDMDDALEYLKNHSFMSGVKARGELQIRPGVEKLSRYVAWALLRYHLVGEEDFEEARKNKSRSWTAKALWCLHILGQQFE